MLAFFRGNLFDTPVDAGYDPSFIQNFNPQYGLPAVVTAVTRVDRGFTESANTDITRRFEDFTGPTGTSLYGVPNDAAGISISHGGIPNHDPSQRAGLISWTATGGFFQTNWAAAGQGRDIQDYATLDPRVSRQSSGLNPSGPTNFSIRLVIYNGALSAPVSLSSYADLRGPVGGGYPGNPHPILQTARIPLTAFTSTDLSRVRGVRLTFDATPSGAIYVGDIRLSLLSGSPFGVAPSLAPSDVSWAHFLPTAPPVKRTRKEMINIISGIRAVPSSSVLEDQPGVEIEVTSSAPFPVRNELVVLGIGGRDFTLSRYPEDGNTNTLIFTLTPEEFEQLVAGDPVTVRYGREQHYDERDFGPLDKSMLGK